MEINDQYEFLHAVLHFGRNQAYVLYYIDRGLLGWKVLHNAFCIILQNDVIGSSYRKTRKTFRNF